MAHSVMNYCLQITDVVLTKKTQQLNVGDFIVRINDKPAIDFYDIEDYDADEYRYHCVKCKDSENVIVESTVPIAVEVKPTKQALLHRIYEDYDYDLVYQLWETGDWGMLKKAVKDQSTTLGAWTKAQFYFKHKIKLKYSPALLFNGILDYHNGATLRAERRIQTFIDKSDTMNATDYAALAYYYMGLLSKGDSRQQYFEAAAQIGRHARTKHLVKLLSEHVELPAEVSLESQSFPADVDLANILEKGRVVHLETMIKQGSRAYTPVCLMPNYRANYYYSQILHLHNTMLNAFTDFFNPMIVLLGSAETRYAERAGSKALAEELPLLEKQQLILLKDYDCFVADAVNEHYSPNIYLIDQAGIVVQHGLDKPIDYWRLFDKQVQGRVN